MDEVKTSLLKLLNHIERIGLDGIDPYDALNSPFLGNSRSKWFRTAATATFRISPISLRGPFRIPRGKNPKALGLLLSAYSRLHSLNIINGTSKLEMLGTTLADMRSSGYSGSCWGYNFPWQSGDMLLPPGAPTIVCSSYIAHGLLDYYDVVKQPEILEMARSTCDFILKDLYKTDTDKGACFSYTPFRVDFVHNANVLGASVLARVFHHTNEDSLFQAATEAFDFTVNHQGKDGRWDYSIDPPTGKTRVQTDWHQGFILDSLIWYLKATDSTNTKYLNSVRIGTEFYKRQFDKDGRAFWRYPRFWPVDIHNQAQGITTFSRLEGLISNSIDSSRKIAGWTIPEMQSPEGFFYYQRWPFITNKINYLRWSQTWMLYALTNLLKVDA